VSDSSNTHLLDFIDGKEYQLEVIGDEVVVMDFGPAWGNMVRMIGASMRGDAAETTKRLHEFMQPNEPVFSFTATPELRALIFEANEWFDTHGEEANEAMCDRIQQIAEPIIRAKLNSSK
jgi:hypothetical protein